MQCVRIAHGTAAQQQRHSVAHELAECNTLFQRRAAARKGQQLLGQLHSLRDRGLGVSHHVIVDAGAATQQAVAGAEPGVHRGGGRASARETAVRVAAGAIAKKWLSERFGVVIRGYLSQLGEIELPFQSWDGVNSNPFFSANAGLVARLEAYLDEVRAARDSVGAKITVVAENVPPGWGEPVFDRLDADIAHAMMSINAAKGVEIGAGFASVAQRGSQHSDELTAQGFASNNAGGILGGISSGQDIVVHTAFKPTSSIPQPRRSINQAGEDVVMQTTGRHDPCVGVRATPICEAMLALVLVDHALRHRAQCGDVHCPTPRIPSWVPR